MKVTFHGAARNVTGSKHIVDANGYRLLLDCGLYQGRRAETYELNKTLPFDVASINGVILSHAHADHCAALPLLIKNGYIGPIYATSATADIARLIMLDSAKLQQADYEHLERHLEGDQKLFPPLYTVEDVEKTAELFKEVPYCRDHTGWTELAAGVRFKFYDAGHILGSAVTVIEADEDGGPKRLLFTGDLGNSNVPILHDPEPIAESIDAIISECTYGDRNHAPVIEAESKLETLIKDAVQNRRKIIVPAFALGRTQQLIYVLHKLHNEQRIPTLPIYIDSPLSNNITEVFKSHLKDFDADARKQFIDHGEAPLDFPKLRYVETKEESKALNDMEGPCIIIASSGMAEGGRILHHLEHGVWKPETIVILTGYQAEHTLGRKLQEGWNEVKIFGREHEVKAEIVTISEFSAHADQRGLAEYIGALKGLKELFLVHTELPSAEAFQTVMKAQSPQLEIVIPEVGQACTV